MKATEHWHSPRLDRDIAMARWGTFGIPVLVFPTAGGDAEEVERMGVVGACMELIDAGRIKLYSVDSLAGRLMLTKEGSPAYRAKFLSLFHECVREEVVPAIHADCHGGQPIIAAGASIGAFNAVAMLCRYPDVFTRAIGMSGTYRIEQFYPEWSYDLYFSSPLQFLPGLGGGTLTQLRQRMIILASGEGEWEDVGESWAMAGALGDKGIPNRVDNWGPDWKHDWETWRAMLPQYLAELT
ncbi:esterase family protein [Segeticoccus rhizosphaerae]|jgi:esterase/lipase superfamily enzyme|uniref:esterase family protein n=1 Tax=Segeticoccus rhizosphaerae TaxID=1104777 RepID=UPI0010C12B42|nr:MULTISPECIES: alpha/beta hydrolase-fold protein [Intrasporangiaceae]